MKKITLLILLFSSIICFSQEQLMLDIDHLYNKNGSGNLRISTKKQFLYETYGAAVSNYGVIFNLTQADFPITIDWKPSGITGGCIPQTWTYTWEEYFDGKTLIGGCAPEYFYIKSPYVNKVIAPVGVCKPIMTGYNVNYYSLTGNAPWNLFPSPRTAESILGSSFRGNLNVKSDIDSYYANPKVTMSSKITTYTIIGCTPELDGQPVADDTKCKFESSGSITIKFKTELNDGERFLFNIFQSPSGTFDKSIFISKAEIINKTFIWTGLAEGTYYIKYQSQTLTDTNDRVGNTAISSDPFSVNSPAALSFSITELQPECNGDQGKVQISASGGTTPYYYQINSGAEIPFTSPVTIDAINGDNFIRVRDKNNCIDKNAND